MNMLFRTWKTGVPARGNPNPSRAFARAGYLPGAPVCPGWAAAFAALALAATSLLPLQLARAQSASPALADGPVINFNVPGNLAIALSNEYPTNTNDANWGNYSDKINYAGYFDPNKCYAYMLNMSQPGQSYFQPVTHSGGPNKHFCDISSLKNTSPPSNTSSFTSASGSTGLWSGNFMNWASMQTIDTVRSALTGGYRVVDRASTADAMPDGTTGSGPLTIIEKAWNDRYYIGKPSSQMRGTRLKKSWYHAYAVQYTFPVDMVGKLTPFGNWPNGQWKRAKEDAKNPVPGGFFTFLKGMGNRMQISPVDSTLYSPPDLPTLWDNNNRTSSAKNLDEINVGVDNYKSSYAKVQPSASPSVVPSGGSKRCSTIANPYPCYQVYVRVSVCDASTGLDGASLLESNCVQYTSPSPSPHYKPEGLFQKYADQLRYSIFSYPLRMDASANTILLRAPMRFIGAVIPDPNLAVTPTPNPYREWNPMTGVMLINPDRALGSTIPNAWQANSLADNKRHGAGVTVVNGGPVSMNNFTSRNSWPTKTGSQNLYYPMDAQGQSGFMNYLNKYGQYYGYLRDRAYKVFDNVDDLYYAALRYYISKGNPWDPNASRRYADRLPPAIDGAFHASTDGFPFVTTWDDPILYRCQKNFILGISDTHTWNGNGSLNYNDIPNLDGDQLNGRTQVDTWVNYVGSMEGIRSSNTWPSNAGNSSPLAWPRWDGNRAMLASGTKSTYYTAGMAYYMHVNDIRPELPALGKINGKVTVDTYWVDMTEFNAIEHLNPYLLAAKYGGFDVPDNYSTARTAALPRSWWNTTGDTMRTHLRGDPTSYRGGAPTGTDMSGGSSDSDSDDMDDPDEDGDEDEVECGSSTVSCWQTVSNGRYSRPDNYFTAADSAQMAASLQRAFSRMVSSLKAYSTAFALASSTVDASGSGSYSAQYSAADWTSTIVGNRLTVTPGVNGAADTLSQDQVWNSDGALTTQLMTQPATSVDDGSGNLINSDSYTGWDTNRRVATWNGSTGVPFRWSNLMPDQKTALYPLTYAGKSITLPGGGADYVNYLRGDSTNEDGSNIAGGSNALRARNMRLGDIINSKLTVVGAPQMLYADSYNPGYAAFKAGPAKTRKSIIYFGANDGMMHAIDATLTDSDGGHESFAYVPDALFKGLPDAPDGTSTAPTKPNNVLAWLGNPNYVHHFSVDATPLAFDVDFDRAGNPGGTGTPDWRTILVGGLGKGGKSFYALDVTDPVSMMSSEAVTAQKVLWEFTAADMGYSYGAPIAVKTAQYGWVIALTSGYGNSDGMGHLYLVNPKTGALLQKFDTPSASNGLAQATAYVADYTDYTADAIYAGDLNGQLWRFDLNSAAATLLARLTDASGAAQPVTTAPLIEIHPSTNKRYVLVGTGRLLDASDITSTPQVQDFYAIIDGKPLAFDPPGEPITRSNLTQIRDTTVATAMPESSKGWYLDLSSPNYNFIRSSTTTGPNVSATGERVIAATASYDGRIAFSTQLMTTDPCLPSVGNLYMLDFSSGQTSLPGNTAYIAQQNLATDLLFAAASDGSVKLLVGDSQGKVTSIAVSGSKGGALQLLNWRNVPVAGN